MKSDKELLKMWERKEKTSRDYWRYYGELTCKERLRVFDLINNLI